jgi:LysR family hydrogen peroxide-inducible transcriptional activator
VVPIDSAPIVELAQARYFLAVSRTLNFTRAAEACNISQPALTRAVQHLESELGGALLFRERHFTQLTELGRLMLPHLESMIHAADSAAALAEALRYQPSVSLRIGLGPGIPAGPVALAIRELAMMLPDLTIRFEEADPGVLAEQMLTNMLDCALLSADCDVPERIIRWPLVAERAHVVMASDHRLAESSVIRATDLYEETLLLSERCGGFVTKLGDACTRQFRLLRCAGSWVYILDLVGAGLGVAILSEQIPIPPPLVARRLVEPDLIRRIDLTAVTGRQHQPAVTSFIKLCRARSFRAGF